MERLPEVLGFPPALWFIACIAFAGAGLFELWSQAKSFGRREGAHHWKVSIVILLFNVLITSMLVISASYLIDKQENEQITQLQKQIQNCSVKEQNK